MNETSKNRRDFLVGGLSVVGAAGLTGIVKNTISSAPIETVKMLRSDGVLVEVDQRVVAPQLDASLRATNAEVRDWMKQTKD